MERGRREEGRAEIERANMRAQERGGEGGREMKRKKRERKKERRERRGVEGRREDIKRVSLLFLYTSPLPSPSPYLPLTFPYPLTRPITFVQCVYECVCALCVREYMFMLAYMYV